MHRSDTTTANGLLALMLAFALALALALPSVARAGELPPGYAPEIEAELALVEQSRSGFDGIAKPDGWQPQLHRAEASSVSSGGGLDVEYVGLGAALALAAAAALTVASRRKVGVAHT